MKKLSSKEQKQLEAEFYEAQDSYLKDGNKAAWDKMFFIMHNAIIFALKKQLLNVKRTDIDDLALDATCQVMYRYKKPEGYKVDYLLTVARFAAMGVLHNDRQKFHDSTLSYEEYVAFELAKENKAN